MTRHRTLPLALPIVAAAALLAGGLAPLAPIDATTTAPVPPPNGTAATLTWSSTLGVGTQDNAAQAAAAHVESGFTDWRLPTLEELQAAVTDADPDTFGQSYYANQGTGYWSSKSQGKMWAFGVLAVSGADFYPIPAQSAGILKVTKPSSTMWVKCVRP